MRDPITCILGVDIFDPECVTLPSHRRKQDIGIGNTEQKCAWLICRTCAGYPFADFNERWVQPSSTLIIHASLEPATTNRV